MFNVIFSIISGHSVVDGALLDGFSIMKDVALGAVGRCLRFVGFGFPKLLQGLGASDSDTVHLRYRNDTVLAEKG